MEAITKQFIQNILDNAKSELKSINEAITQTEERLNSLKEDKKKIIEQINALEKDLNN